MSTQATESTASLYRDYARRWFPGHSELYVQWATGVADSPELLALVSGLPEPKRQPNLVFAAARYLGSGDTDFEDVRDFMLARWPEVAGDRHRAIGPRPTRPAAVPRCCRCSP